MRRNQKSKWLQYSGYIHPAEGDLGESVNGGLIINGHLVPFALTKQGNSVPYANRKQYAYRGSVTIKRNGKLLSHTVHGKTELAKRSLYTSTADRDEVIDYIINKAEELVLDFADVLHLSDVAPELIAPQVAAFKYAERFARASFPEPERQNAVNSIKDVCAKLEHEPMSKFSITAIRDCLSRHKIGKKKTRVVHDFWCFCLDNHYCTGKDPFPSENGRKRRDPAKLQVEAVTSDSLTIDEWDALFEDLERNASDYDIGVALLGSGYSIEDLPGFRWKHIIFDSAIHDLVRVALYDDHNAGATHDLTRPCVPSCARVLRKAHQKLLDKKPEEQLEDMYVICDSVRKDMMREMTSNISAAQPSTADHDAASHCSERDALFGGQDSGQLSLWDPDDAPVPGNSDIGKEAPPEKGMARAEDTPRSEPHARAISKLEDRIRKHVQNEISKHAAYRINRVRQKLGTSHGAPVTAARARSLLSNTYKRRLGTQCGLDEDSGTRLFLSGHPAASDVTNAHYVSNTEPAAVDRLFTTLKVLDKEQALFREESVQNLDDGRKMYTATPRTTHQNAAVYTEILLPPGKHRIEILCPHGARIAAHIAPAPE